jgi:predicted transcriptional regulator
MLKRHLRTMYNMSPDEYRAKWSLPSDYPMVAPNYAKQRSEFAKQIGLGRSGGRDGARARRRRAAT